MNTDKIIIKRLLLISITIALLMSLLGWYESYSQGATSTDADPMLRTYLNGLMLVFFGLALIAKDRKKRIEVGWLNISFRGICFFIVAMVWGIDVTNVVDYSLIDPESGPWIKRTLHMVFTGLTIFSSGFLVWHFYDKNTNDRILAIIAVIIGFIGFLLGFIFHLYSIAWGEFIPTFSIGIVLWPIINEQILKTN